MLFILIFGTIINRMRKKKLCEDETFEESLFPTYSKFSFHIDPPFNAVIFIKYSESAEIGCIAVYLMMDTDDVFFKTLLALF